MLGFQSLESREVTGKVLIVWRLGLLYPYLPDRSRLARGVIGGGAARLAACVCLIPIIGVGVKFIRELGCVTRAMSGSKLCCRLCRGPLLKCEKWGTPGVF